MTETHFTWRWLFVTGAIGVIGGLVLGLMIGWFIGPAASATVDVAALSASGQNDYMVIVANAFAYDNDLPRARERLLLLKDEQVNARVERLAKALAARKDPSAAYVADLAVALGSSDSALRVLAASISNTQSSDVIAAGPTKFAAPEATETEIPSPTVETATPTEAPTGQPTVTPTIVATRIPQAPQATRSPKPAPPTVPPTPAPAQNIPGTVWLPPLSTDWPVSAFSRPANVQPGQGYWHLVKAIYCDIQDQRNNCPDLAGGGNGTNIYVMLMNPDGSRAESDLNVLFDNGNGGKVGTDIIGIKDSSDPCNCNYSFESSNYLIQVAGISDAAGGLCLCSRYTGWGSHAHVRYFFWFQKTTR